jgi:ABC-2 type transport system permease protein
MSNVSAYASGALAMLRRDLSVFVSYRLRTISVLLSTAFGLVLFYYISRLVRVGQFETADDYFAFVVIGMVSLSVLTSTLATGPATIRQELVAGTFERLLVSPFGAVAGIVSLSLFPLLYGLFIGLVTLILAALFFDLPITWSTAPLALPIGILGAMSFLPFGLLISAAMLTVKQAQSASSFVVTGIAIVAGLYFPVTLLPGWIQWLSEVQPFTPSVDLLRNVLVGTPLPGEAWVALLKIAGFTAVLTPLSLVVLASAVALGRRRGTISEY